MGRHRHAVTVRADGLAAVLGSLLNDPRVLGAVLVDVDSGMVLDACPAPPASGGAEPAAGAGIGGVDPELVGAGHAELSRVALALPGHPGRETTGDELVVSRGPTRHHLLRAVPDPHGDRLVLAVVVDGTRRFAERVRRKLRGVPPDALTAGPTVVRRPGTGGWATSPPVGVRPMPPHTPGPYHGAATGRAGPVPGGLFDPSPSGPVAPGGPGGDARRPFPFPPSPLPAPPLPPPALIGGLPDRPGTGAPTGGGGARSATGPVPAAVSAPAAPSLFTPGVDLRAAAPDSGHGRGDGRSQPRPGRGARVRAPEQPSPDVPRPPAPPSALPPGRSG